MKIFKIFYKKIKILFYTKETPIGLNSLGIKKNYLERFNKFCYNKIKFSVKILSPVNIPYYLR